MNDVQLQELLQDLYNIDPDLKEKEAELIPIINTLLEQKPEGLPTKEFAESLKNELAQKAQVLSSVEPSEPKGILFPFPVMRFAYIFVGILIGAAFAGPAVYYSVNQGDLPMPAFESGRINKSADRAQPLMAEPAEQLPVYKGEERARALPSPVPIEEPPMVDDEALNAFEESPQVKTTTEPEATSGAPAPAMEYSAPQLDSAAMSSTGYVLVNVEDQDYEVWLGSTAEVSGEIAKELPDSRYSLYLIKEQGQKELIKQIVVQDGKVYEVGQ